MKIITLHGLLSFNGDLQLLPLRDPTRGIGSLTFTVSRTVMVFSLAGCFNVTPGTDQASEEEPLAVYHAARSQQPSPYDDRGPSAHCLSPYPHGKAEKIKKLDD